MPVRKFRAEAKAATEVKGNAAKLPARLFLIHLLLAVVHHSAKEFDLFVLMMPLISLIIIYPAKVAFLYKTFAFLR